MKNILLRIKSIQYLLYRIFGFLQGSYTLMFHTLRMLKRGRMLKMLLNQIEQIKKVVAQATTFFINYSKIKVPSGAFFVVFKNPVDCSSNPPFAFTDQFPRFTHVDKSP